MSSRIIETARFSATAANGQRHTIIELVESGVVLTRG